LNDFRLQLNKMIEELNEEVSQKFLEKHSIGRLGCILETGEPYVVPVAYIFEEGDVYVHSLPGQKISALRKNPKVCLQINEISEDGFEWKSVIAFGEFEEIKDKDKKTSVLFEFYEKFPQFTPVEAKFDAETSIKKVIVFRININRLTGVTECY
jgi:nitroimidazol reductase NimA-like FMN-containing flavoprotein (pyridoxamine 5'-phosphate oxidase superfamily)